jgi:hypothetical protein
MKRIHLTDHLPLVRISASFTPELYDWVRSEASLHRVSVSKLVHDLVAAQRDLRRQLATGVGDANGEGEPGPPVLHVLLERTKEEIGRSIDAQAAEVAALREHVSLAVAMLDRAYYAYLLHTPPVPEPEQPRARSEAQRRYEKWTAEVRALAPPRPGRSTHGRPNAAPTAAGAPDRETPA